MTKYANNTKVLKAVMAGAVAFTPVLAVGVNVEKVSAATNYTEINSLISKLNVAFDSLSNINKTHLRNAHTKINAELDSNEWKTDLTLLLEESVNGNQNQKLAAEKVVGSLVALLASTSTGYEMESSFNTFDSTITGSDIDSAFTGTVNKAQFISYLAYIEDQIFTTLNTSQNYSTYFEVFEDVLYASLANDTHNDVAVAIAQTVKENEVKAVLQNIVNDAGILQAEKDAFESLAKNYTPTPPSSGGGGGFPAPGPVAGGNGEVTTGGGTIESNPQSVIDAINNATTVEKLVIELAVGTEIDSIPATILTALYNKNDEAVVVIVAGDATYEVPVAQINLSSAATKLGVASAELKLKVTLDEVTNPLAGKANFKTLSDAIDFNLSIIAPDGKSLELKYFNNPVKRSITTVTTLNPLTTVGVVVNANGTVVAVPTFVPATAKSANLYRNSNSVYTLIENSKTFTDVDKGASWAEEYVEKLASRMVVNGVNTDSFKPSQMINRGEFAAILARGLGLVAENMTAKDFKDVSLSQGFNKNGEIAAVVDAGLVKGYEDGSFRPYEEITRDQAAIMISRAIDYINSDLVKLDTAKKISNFKDSKEIGAASRTHVEKVYQAGYLEGFTDNTFRPTSEANRAQMAKILYNFLESIEYIN